MIVQVKLFAAAKDLLGRDVLEIELADDPRIADLRAAIVESHPSLKPIIDHARFAIDHEFASDQNVVFQDSEIACIPPVSGG